MFYQLKKDQYSSHNQIASLIIKKILNSKKISILDLGCDTGFLGKTLVKFKNNFKLYGVDVNKKNLQKAKKHYHKLYCFDLNNSHWPIKQKFDVLVLADILEHLPKAENFLVQSIEYLKKSGYLIISIPNSVHFFFRWKILLGQFPKDDRGLFDKSHLNFFTLKTINDLFKKNCLNIKFYKIYVTTIPLPMVFGKYGSLLPVKLLYELSYKLAKLRPSLFAYQYIFLGKKIN